MRTPPKNPFVVNGKRYSLWPQFVIGKNEWIGGILEDLGQGGESHTTTIKDITFEPNGDDSAIFEVHGEDFSCASDVQYLAVDPGGPTHSLGLIGYGGHRWRITRPEVAFSI